MIIEKYSDLKNNNLLFSGEGEKWELNLKKYKIGAKQFTVASIDGNYLAISDQSGFDDNIIFLFHIKSQSLLAKLYYSKPKIKEVIIDFSVDTQYLISAMEKLIIIYKISKVENPIQIELRYRPRTFETDIYQKLFVCPPFQARIDIFNLQTGQKLSSFDFFSLQRREKSILNFQPISKNQLLVNFNSQIFILINSKTGKILQNNKLQIYDLDDNQMNIKSFFGYQQYYRQYLKIFFIIKWKLLRKIKVFQELECFSIISYLTTDLVILASPRFSHLYNPRYRFSGSNTKEVHCFKGIVYEHPTITDLSIFESPHPYTLIKENIKKNQYEIITFKQQS